MNYVDFSFEHDEEMIDIYNVGVLRELCTVGSAASFPSNWLFRIGWNKQFPN